jgi:hypothetical protein
MADRIMTLPFLYDVRFKAPKSRTPQTHRVVGFLEVSVPIADEPPLGLILHEQHYGIDDGSMWWTVGGRETPTGALELEDAVKLRDVWKHMMWKTEVHPLASTQWPCVPADPKMEEGVPYRSRNKEPEKLGDILYNYTLPELEENIGRMRDFTDNRAEMETLWRAEYARKLMVSGKTVSVRLDEVPAWIVSNESVHFYWDSRSTNIYYCDKFPASGRDDAVAWAKVRGIDPILDNEPTFLDLDLAAGLDFDVSEQVLRQLKSGLSNIDMPFLREERIRDKLMAKIGSEAVEALDEIRRIISIDDPLDAASTVNRLVQLIPAVPADADETMRMVANCSHAMARWEKDPSVENLRNLVPEENDASLVGFTF